MKITARQLCTILNGELIGDGERIITAAAKIEEAKPDQVSFIANPKYEQYASSSEAGVLVVAKAFQASGSIKATLIKVEDPYASFSKILAHYNKESLAKTGIEEQSFIDPSVKIGQDVYVGAFTYLSPNASIGNNVKLFPHCYIGDNVTIGDNTVLYPGVKVLHHCTIGGDCVIHSGAVIGSDGFGFTPKANGGYDKIPQTGNVIIEDHVEIGANTTIDRATLGSTIIKKGVKLDNLVQVAHNVEVDENTAIAAQSGISGSTKLGKNCMVGGQVGFVGHISIAAGSKINAQSGVSRNIDHPDGAWMGSPAFEYNKSLKSQVIFRNLPALEKRVRELEIKIKQLNRGKAE